MLPLRCLQRGTPSDPRHTSSVQPVSAPALSAPGQKTPKRGMVGGENFSLGAGASLRACYGSTCVTTYRSTASLLKGVLSSLARCAGGQRRVWLTSTSQLIPGTGYATSNKKRRKARANPKPPL
eukprot:6181314-Pleurochrysis_carterae.AAC.1